MSESGRLVLWVVRFAVLPRVPTAQTVTAQGENLGVVSPKPLLPQRGNLSQQPFLPKFVHRLQRDSEDGERCRGRRKPVPPVETKDRIFPAVPVEIVSTTYPSDY